MTGIVERKCARFCLCVASPYEVILNGVDVNPVLDDEEKERARRYLRSADAGRYRAAHGLTRLLISLVTGRDPQKLRFEKSLLGKPFLLAGEPFDFSLSHGGDWVSVAVSTIGRVGIDVEAEQSELNWQQVAPAFLSQNELRTTRPDKYLKTWTAKEAALKALGVGFNVEPNSLTIRHEGSRKFAVDFASTQLKGQWRMLDRSHVMAVASEHEDPIIAVCESTCDLRKLLKLRTG